MTTPSFTFGFGVKSENAVPQKTEQKEPENELVENEEISVSDGGAAKFAPVEVKSGEEAYEVRLKLKAKIWRFDEGENQWKERGQGEAKIMQHQVNKGHLFILRRDGTGKLGAQHALGPGINLEPNAASEKAFVWTSPADFSDDDEGHPETFAIRFATKEMADEFKKVFDAVTGKAA